MTVWSGDIRSGWTGSILALLIRRTRDRGIDTPRERPIRASRLEASAFRVRIRRVRSAPPATFGRHDRHHVSPTHARRRELRPRARVTRPAVRRRLLRGHQLDHDLLPSRLPGARGVPRPPPVLRVRGGGGTRRVPALPPLPARARAGAGPGGCRAPGGAGGGAPHRGRSAQRARRRPARARARRGRAPASPRDGARARRLAGRAGADPPPAPRQVPADRYGAAGDPGRVRERLPEPAPVQRRCSRSATA